MKKSLAVMLALIMVLCMIPTTAFAADIIDQKNNEVYIYKGEPINYKFLRKLVGESITKQENEEVTWQRLPRYTNICRNCGSVLVEVIPDYRIDPVKNIEIEYPEVIGKYGVRVANWKGGQGYDGNPCFEFYCKAAKAGETDVKVTYYYNYNYPGESGYCNRCGNFVYVQPQTNWYQESVTFHVKFVGEDPVGIPDKPTDISGIVGESAVKVHCTTNTSHTDNTYGLISGSFTIGDVTKDTTSGNYTCTITVQSEKYVNDYSASIKVNHELDGSSTGTIKLKWNETGKKWVVDSTLPVVFDVKCKTTQPPTDEPPTKPEPENTPAIPGLTDFDAAVKVKCETVPETHKEKTFGFNWFSCKVGEVTGNEADGYTCTIEVLPGGYVDSYNALYYSGHTLVGPENYTITLNWDTANNKWSYTENKLPITFTVKCDTVEPTKPDKPGEGVILDLINKINVQCIANTDPKHPEKGYDPIEGSYDVGEVSGDKENGYTCEITVKPEKYVEKYNADVTGTNHTLAAGEGNKTVTLKYDSANNEWKVDIGMPVVFKVTCETVPEETYYTVTYTDGVGGTAFANQVQRVKRGAPTPAFNGIPSRSGYTFTGWAPAVTDTVTGNVTYTAQWKNNDNHTPGGGNGSGGHYHPTTPVPVIVIPPKTGDMTIWQSILHFLGIR